MSTLTPIAKKFSYIISSLFRSVWLFFSGILFLLASFGAFVKLTQGKDLMVLSSERPGNFIFFLISLICLVLVCWYGARLVAEARKEATPGYLPAFLFQHVPRFIGFSFFTLFIIAFLQTVLFSPLSNIFYWAIFLLSFPYYWLWTVFIEKKFIQIVFNWIFFSSVAAIILASVLVSFKLKNNEWLIWLDLLLIQWGFLVFVITRRKWLDDVAGSRRKQAKLPGMIKNLSRKAGINPAEELFHVFFVALGIFVLVVYIRSTFSVPFAVYITPFPFVLLAFAVFAGVGAFLTHRSVKWGFNIHLLLVIFVFIIGFWTERHKVALVNNGSANFKQRAPLKQYFKKWVDERKEAIDTSASYPVYFVLADGGASRSGYWVASVLSRLQDETGGRFGKHLFCLSGASGGSVGNASFYLLLKKRGNNNVNPADSLFLKDSRAYLKSDFLTYTASRMLGHDFFVQLWPFSTAGDRAAALTEALEEAPEGNGIFLKDSINMNTRLSELMSDQRNIRAALPILCVNTTRMQDGKPSVISTINIKANERDFNNRLDVLDLLQDTTLDMKLSSAVVLGASFPYLSPAGRIDGKVKNSKDSLSVNYFVDGGYVDNSGAGVVHEMIIQIRRMILESAWDDETKNRFAKLNIQVIHITNGPSGDMLVHKVNPFVNDLAAPIKTLAGSYGIQTTVNDSRLKNYMRDIPVSITNYWDINLYRPAEPLKYSMNWVISKRTLDSMDNRLYQHKELNNLAGIMKQTLK
ncbi:MAG: patatin-like phospholipase family protein [Chitinophagaceae bacterium]|nr:patatin-like phospholipase family protein [Chitinophagaceae bacterium]